MGTSQSSSGPGAEVALIPPWVEDLPPVPQAGEEELPLDADGVDEKPLPLAPPGRFGPARLNLGRFAKSGNGRNMRRGLAHYVHQGYGGGNTMARRMGSTARTAARLGSVLQSGQQPDLAAARDAVILNGKNAETVLDAIVEAVRPTDGTQDAEASRLAIRDALSDVLDRYPDADLLDLSNAEREYVQERYVALDVFNRFELDVGAHLREHAPSVGVAMERLAEVRAYVWETVAAAFRKVRELGTARGADFADVTQQALAETFYVFEGYLP